MTRQVRLFLLLAGAALAVSLVAASCAGRGEPDPAYLDSLRTMTASQLLHEHKALRAEEQALAARLAETQTGDLPPTAREAAQRSLDDSLRTVQAKRRAVDGILASGGYARNEMRYPVQPMVLRAEAPAEQPSEHPAGAAKPEAPKAPAQEHETPAAAPPAAEPAPAPKPRAVAEAPAAPASPPPPPAAPAAPRAVPAPAAAGQAQVLGVETARTPQGLEVRVRLAGKPARKYFTMTGPPRIVLDITGVAEPGFRLFNRTLDAVEARTLRLGWHDAKAMLRLVLDTDAAHLGKAAVEEAPDGLVLRVTP